MRRPGEQRVQRALREAPVPEEARAEERGWAVVREAFAERAPVQPPRRVRWRLALAAVGAGTAAALALTPAGAEVRDWIEDAISGEESARSALSSLPAPGALLVAGEEGAWVVRDDGSRRRLGAYEHVAWSPHGLYVGAAAGRELRALTPVGETRWAIAAPGDVGAIDWSSDEGYRVAYISLNPSGGRELRVVAGDGTGDATLVPSVGSAAIAWQPESSPDPVHRLAYVDRHRRVALIDADSGDVLWRSERVSAPVERLQWSEDGERLLVVASGRFALAFTAAGDPILKGPVAAVSGHVTLAPDGESVALARSNRAGGGTVELSRIPTFGGGRVLYRTSPGTGTVRFGAPIFSPDGKWLLVPWPQADQWLFIRIADRRVVAVADISRLLDSGRRGAAHFPVVAGWCC